jgi:hypothetical protein
VQVREKVAVERAVSLKSVFAVFGGGLGVRTDSGNVPADAGKRFLHKGTDKKSAVHLAGILDDSACACGHF